MHSNFVSALTVDVTNAPGFGVATTKAINATGDVDIVGNLGVTGDVRIVDNAINTIDTISLNTGNDGADITSTYPAVDHDRIIYIVSMNTFGNVAITGGGFSFEGLVGGASIFYKFTDHGGPTVPGRQTNHITNGSFIVPAGLSFEIKRRRYTLTIFNGPYNVYIRSHRFGRV